MVRWMMTLVMTVVTLMTMHEDEEGLMHDNFDLNSGDLDGKREDDVCRGRRSQSTYSQERALYISR